MSLHSSLRTVLFSTYGRSTFFSEEYAILFAISHSILAKGRGGQVASKIVSYLTTGSCPYLDSGASSPMPISTLTLHIKDKSLPSGKGVSKMSVHLCCAT